MICLGRCSFGHGRKHCPVGSVNFIVSRESAPQKIVKDVSQLLDSRQPWLFCLFLFSILSICCCNIAEHGLQDG